MKIALSTLLDIPAEQAWSAVRQSRLLEHVASPLQAFEPVDPPALPEQWSDGSYLVRLRLFGWLPLGTQWIVISTLEQGPDRYRLRDDGRGALVAKWDHLITIEPITRNWCRYTDEVEVQAGFLTPAITAFAHVFYRHRQRRWRGLVAAGFKPLLQGEPA